MLAFDIKQFLRNNIYMTIATADGGKPWITPIFYAFDDLLNLYWYSGKDTQHSNFIKHNPQIAVVIYNSGTPEGQEVSALYLQANAFELGEEELDHAIKIYFERSKSGDDMNRSELLNKEDFLDPSPLRMYKAVIDSASILGESSVYHGKWIDHRIPIKLN